MSTEAPEAPPDAPIGGSCDPRFAPVREAFAQNFADQDEVGASLCVVADGLIVVDLWGGHSDRGGHDEWRADTLVNAYSVGKGVAALLLLALVEQRRVDLDAPVARYWPEFAASGKEGVTVRTLLAHRAGLPGVRERLPDDAHYDWGRMCDALAAQEPYWKPDSAHGYHVNSFGYLIGEVVRRVTGLDYPGALRQIVTGPLGDADFFCGLPRSEHTRVARTQVPQIRMTGPEDWSRAFPPTGDDAHDEMIWHAYFNPSGLSGTEAVNSEAWRLASIPSTNSHASARGVAAIYAALLEGGPRGAGWPGRALLREATSVHSEGDDIMLGRPSRFGLGFQLSHPDRPVGGEAGFGHYGYGGTLGLADPEAGLALGYLMNRPGDRWRTPRTQRLVGAVYDCLGGPI